MLRSRFQHAARVWFVAIGLAGVAAAADAPAEKFALRYKFAADSTLMYTISNEASYDIQVGQTAETVANSTESGRRLRTVAVNPDGSAVLEIQIEYVNLSAGNGQISWDSRSKTAPPEEFTGIDKTIGKPLMKITVSPTGDVIAAENDGQTVSGEQLASAQFDILPMLPADPVAIGESWHEPFQIGVVTDGKLPKRISLQRTYTLKAVSNGIAEIEVQTGVLTPLQDPQEEGQLVEQTPSGTVRLDIAQGRVLERLMQLDNKVVGFKGPQTAIRVVRVHQESLSSGEKSAALPTARPAM
ncbi:MAG: DUF6263 family protein [Planctomycetaceae bacterium]